MEEIKYIAVEWPEYQIFMEHPRFREECYYCSDSNIYFIPEDLYDEIMYPPYELPEEYRENYTMELTDIKRGQKVLVMIRGTLELKVSKVSVNWNAYRRVPIMLEDRDLLDGINCYVIAVEKESVQNEN